MRNRKLYHRCILLWGKWISLTKYVATCIHIHKHILVVERKEHHEKMYYKLTIWNRKVEHKMSFFFTRFLFFTSALIDNVLFQKRKRIRKFNRNTMKKKTKIWNENTRNTTKYLFNLFTQIYEYTNRMVNIYGILRLTILDTLLF